uniref:Glycoprotein endo-alpha-1,2-mannosidase n=1 Tax=Romanomermis culicivorax TaxID=13658 RepID=A0A915KQM9_ROMCU
MRFSPRRVIIYFCILFILCAVVFTSFIKSLQNFRFTKISLLYDDSTSTEEIQILYSLSESFTTIRRMNTVLPTSTPSINYNVHIFYYPWYGDLEIDGKYFHWDHNYLPHWKAEVNEKYADLIGKKHDPKINDLACNFYPVLGPYSSRNRLVIEQHMKWIRSTGTGVVVVSWYPPGKADDNGKPWDDLMSVVMDIAAKYDLKIAFHLEPYRDRSPDSIHGDINYIIENYANHSAFFYYSSTKGPKKPVFYIYDSYLIEVGQWRRFFDNQDQKSDAYFLGLIVQSGDERKILNSGFHGFYTYFGADGFSYGSKRRNWIKLSKFSKENNLLSSFSVAPGYIDERVRPWNKENTRPRQNGSYYEQGWRFALKSNPDFVSITSFNEWHEGTQIEPSITKISGNGFAYEDFSPNKPDYYLQLTTLYVKKFKK